MATSKLTRLKRFFDEQVPVFDGAMGTMIQGHKLEEADYRDAAQLLEPALVQTALDAIRSHLDQQGNLRSQAIAENLIAP